MTYDVAIVGNGILGLSTALALVTKDPTAKVAIFGRFGRPLGATPAAGAMLGTFGEVVAPLLKTPAGRARLEKACLAQKLWPAWLEAINAQLPSEEQIHVCPGTFVINNTRSFTIDEENYDAIVTWLQEKNEPFENVDPRKIPGLHPNPEARPLRALYMPDEGSLDPNRLVAGLERILARASVTFVDDDVRSVKVAGSRVTGVETGSGETIEARKVLLVNGASAQKLLDQIPDLARKIPHLFFGGGCSLVIGSAEWVQGGTRATIGPNVIRTPNRAFACGLHVVPRSDATELYVGASNQMQWSEPFTSVNVSDTAFLLDCLVDQINEDYIWCPIKKFNWGNRPVALDTCPLLGPTSLEGLWMLNGTYRDGLQASPLLAQDTASRLLGGPALYDHPFAPERRPLPMMTREDMIAYAQAHGHAAIIEHRAYAGTKIGLHRSNEEIGRMIIRSLYDQLAQHTDYVVPADILIPAGATNPDKNFPVLGAWADQRELPAPTA